MGWSGEGARCVPGVATDCEGGVEPTCAAHGKNSSPGLACSVAAALGPAHPPSSVAPVNASIRLLEQVLPSVVHVRARIPERHPSARILGIGPMGPGIGIDPGGPLL